MKSAQGHQVEGPVLGWMGGGGGGDPSTPLAVAERDGGGSGSGTQRGQPQTGAGVERRPWVPGSLTPGRQWSTEDPPPIAAFGGPGALSLHIGAGVTFSGGPEGRGMSAGWPPGVTAAG